MKWTAAAMSRRHGDACASSGKEAVGDGIAAALGGKTQAIRGASAERGGFMTFIAVGLSTADVATINHGCPLLVPDRKPTLPSRRSGRGGRGMEVKMEGICQHHGGQLVDCPGSGEIKSSSAIASFES